jgi:site-specific DNA-methyltransferase (cytosine-N4-specific)
MYKATLQKELSFAGEKLTRGRHKIHPYPAMLHPLLVDYLIKKYARNDDTIFDPFCGSGVTLLQASASGYKSVGFDINPLALLIAKVKTGKYDIKKLKTEFLDFKKSVLSAKKADIPEIKNIDYWYSKDVIQDLGRVRTVLKNKKYKYKDFFVINFAYICRKQSLTRNGEFKRYRVKADKIDGFENKVFEKLFEHIEAMIDVISKSDIPKKESYPKLANSEVSIPPDIKYDLVITSPPYGDSRTTVAYGEFSSFGSEWTDDLNTYGGNDYKVDKESVGKIGKLNDELQKHKVLLDTLKKIEKIDKKRADEVMYFFNGYYNVVRNVVNNLNKKGRVCFVVGNRRVKGYQIPMDQITASFLESLGLKFEDIFIRDILNKVMPSQNSPSNKVGVKLQTMVNEYIVVFQKK